jgi:hypothetical protein
MIMKRREFFGSAGLLATAFGMPWPAPASNAPAASSVATSAARHAILLQTSALAGFQFHHGATLWPQLKAKQSVTLVREPDNAFDQNAIRVEWRGQKIGYVPRRENTVAAGLIDRGENLVASISALVESDDPWARVRLEISLQTSAA